jgi:hypothetical protein
MVPKRARFRWRNRKRREITEFLINTLQKRCDEARRAGVQSYLTIYNVGLFIALFEQDLSAYSEGIFFARSEWHRQFFARGMAVLLHEGATDFPEMLGKAYRKCILDLDLESHWIDKLNKIGSQLSLFRKSHVEFLSEVRNYVGAHRDHNALTQIEVLAKFTAFDVYKLGADFSQPLRDLTHFYIGLLTRLHQPSVMLRSVLKAVNGDSGKSE